MTDAVSGAEGPVIGVLLAGGLARRMGGGDKPLRMIAGKTILDHVIERLAPQCSDMVINANGDAARFAPWHLPVVSDSVAGFAGPLSAPLSTRAHRLHLLLGIQGVMADGQIIAGPMPEHGFRGHFFCGHAGHLLPLAVFPRAAPADHPSVLLVRAIGQQVQPRGAGHRLGPNIVGRAKCSDFDVKIFHTKVPFVRLVKHHPDRVL
jgi:hypothetical protein